jgi:hypothetical protein
MSAVHENPDVVFVDGVAEILRAMLPSDAAGINEARSKLRRFLDEAQWRGPEVLHDWQRAIRELGLIVDHDLSARGASRDVRLGLVL